MKKYARNTHAVSNNSIRVLKANQITIDEVVTEILSQQLPRQTNPHLPEKALLKATDVCQIFQVSRPTLYEWLKQNKLKSFKDQIPKIFFAERH